MGTPSLGSSPRLKASRLCFHLVTQRHHEQPCERMGRRSLPLEAENSSHFCETTAATVCEPPSAGPVLQYYRVKKQRVSNCLSTMPYQSQCTYAISVETRHGISATLRQRATEHVERSFHLERIVDRRTPARRSTASTTGGVTCVARRRAVHSSFRSCCFVMCKPVRRNQTSTSSEKQERRSFRDA